MVRLQKTKSGQHFLTIPKYIVEALKLEKGDEIRFYLDMGRGVIEIKKYGD